MYNFQIAVSDITGTTGMAIIRAIVAGEHDPKVLGAKKHHRVKRSEAEIAAALDGDYRQEHLFVLQQELQLYDFFQTQIADCDRQIEQCLAQFNDKIDTSEFPLPKPKNIRHKPQGNEPGFDLRTHLYRMTGVDFTRIDGLGVLTVQTIISEVGLNPKRFPTVKQFTSWLGLCPGSRVTGGKVKSSQTRTVVNRAANAFRMAAQTAGKSNSAQSVLFIVAYVLVLVLPKLLLPLLIKLQEFSISFGHKEEITPTLVWIITSNAIENECLKIYKKKLIV